MCGSECHTDSFTTKLNSTSEEPKHVTKLKHDVNRSLAQHKWRWCPPY